MIVPWYYHQYLLYLEEKRQLYDHDCDSFQLQIHSLCENETNDRGHEYIPHDHDYERDCGYGTSSN